MSRVKLTEDLITRTHNIFLSNDKVIAGILFSRSELRALERKGYLQKKLAKYGSGSLFWVYSGTSKLFTS